MRTHVVLPEELVKAVDALAGKGKRSRFVEEAVRDKLKKERLLAALKDSAGTLSGEDHSHWETPEQVASWVRELRRESDQRLERFDRG